VAARQQAFLRRQDERSGGLAHHPFDDVDAEDFLGHGMLDLKARVDFQEIGFRALDVVNEFNGSGGFVGDGAPEGERGLAHRSARRVGKMGGRRFFHDFLIASLQRAIAVAKRDDAAASVAENLHLDVASLFDEMLDIGACVAEAGARQTSDACKTILQLARISAQTHADAAAPGRTFQHHRIADAIGLHERLLAIVQETAAGQKRHVRGVCDRPRFVFEAEGANMLGSRPDEGDALRRQSFRKTDVFGEKAIAGMNRLGAGFTAGGDDLVDVQIGVAKRAVAQANQPVSLTHRRREAVAVGGDGDGFHPQSLERAHYARSDFAAIGDQNAFEHRPINPHPIRVSVWAWD
jgi:hypothetical protein